MSLEAVGDWFEGVCGEGVFATAGQCYAWSGDQALDLVVGERHTAEPLEPDDVSEVFCLTKPVVAVGALLALERVGQSPTSLVEEVLGDEPVDLADSVSVAQVVNHDARLKAPPGLTWMLSQPGERPAVEDLTQDLTAPRCYSEVSGWVILTAVIRHLTGQDPAVWLTNEVLMPLGLLGEVVFAPAEVADVASEGRILVPVGGLPVDQVPMLHVFAPGYQQRIGPEFGGLASARAIGRFTESLADVRNGAHIDGLPTQATLQTVADAASPSALDGTWNRTTSFATAYETVAAVGPDGPVTLHQLSGYIAMATVTVDPTANTGICMVLNGGIEGTASLNFLRDQALRLLGYTNDDQ